MITGRRKATDLKSYGINRTPIGDPPTTPKCSAKKNSKRWCKGRVGREHKVQWLDGSVVRGRMNTPQLSALEMERQERAQREAAAGQRVWLGMELLVCSECGRHLDWRRKALPGIGE